MPPTSDYYESGISLPDSVGQTLLWTMLGRTGLPTKILAAIRHSHHTTQARILTDGGEGSDWLGVVQGLRQGCVLTPLMFNIVFAVVLHVAA